MENPHRGRSVSERTVAPPSVDEFILALECKGPDLNGSPLIVTGFAGETHTLFPPLKLLSTDDSFTTAIGSVGEPFF